MVPQRPETFTDSKCRGRGQACQEGQSSLKDEKVKGSRLCLVALVRGKPLSEPGVIVHLWNPSTWDVEAGGSRVSEFKGSPGLQKTGVASKQTPSTVPSQASWYLHRKSILQ